MARGQKKSKRRGPYAPDERKLAVEAYLKSGLTQKDFCKTWGITPNTMIAWLKQYGKAGPRGLERSSFRDNPKKRGAKGISRTLKSEIVQTKQANPTFGLRKVRHFLMRFRGVKVSTGTIRKTMKAEGLPTIVVRRKRRRSSDKVRTFERAKPMQLWQSDITSITLPRPGTRSYLTVFLDDYSRYIVGWEVELRQKQDLVINALLKGIERFGKPEEVLTDQGRQYFSWRGKSDFQKLLIKQGIKHVVARSHHPQTVGKCERLWETINKELLERVRPQSLEELRERLTHFFNHYNHFRPHQGIAGMTPADRFFGVESEVRRALESSFAANQIRLAVDEKPRSPVFLIGQIGDKPITMHGEAGRLVVQTPDGDVRQINYDHFGHKKGEQSDENQRRESEGEGPGESNRGETQEGAPAARHESAADACSSGTLAVGGSNSGAAGAGASDGGSNPGVLDGTHQSGGGGQASGDTDPSSMAAVTTGDLRYASGVTRTAQDTSQGGNHGSERRSESVEKENSGVGGDDQKTGSVDLGSAIDAGVQGSAASGNPESAVDEHSGSQECSNDDEQDDQGTRGSSR